MFANTWSILSESALYILVGFLIAGLLDALAITDRVMPWLRRGRTRSVVLAALVGVPLPLCSCGVLPTAVALRRKGASRGATLSFLVSTPETSITSVLMTYALIGPVMAIIRPIAACVSALAAGLAETFLPTGREPPQAPTELDACCRDRAGSGVPLATDHQPEEPGEDGSCCGGHRGPAPGAAPEHKQDGPAQGEARWRRGVRFAFVDLFDDVIWWIVLGIVAAAAIQTFLPADLLGRILGGEARAMLLMILVGIPLYVCAEGSTPIAAALMAQGLSPGAALVFLLVGPATNIGSIGVLRQLLGTRSVVIYLATLIIVAVLMGIGTNLLFAREAVAVQARALDEPLLPTWLKAAAAIALLLLTVVSIVRRNDARQLAGRIGGLRRRLVRDQA